MRQRQVGDVRVLVGDELGDAHLADAREKGLDGDEQIAVRDHDSLGCAGAAARVHDDGKVVLGRLGEVAYERLLGARLEHVLERVHGHAQVALRDERAELGHVVHGELVREDDEVPQRGGYFAHDLVKLGQLLAARDHQRRLALVYAVGERLHAKRRVQRHHGALDAKASERAHHPLGSRLGEQHDVLVGAEAESEQAVAQIVHLGEYLLECGPLVVAERVLFEHLAVRLGLFLDGEHLADAEDLLGKEEAVRFV